MTIICIAQLISISINGISKLKKMSSDLYTLQVTFYLQFSLQMTRPFTQMDLVLISLNLIWVWMRNNLLKHLISFKTLVGLILNYHLMAILWSKQVSIMDLSGLVV